MQCIFCGKIVRPALVAGYMFKVWEFWPVGEDRKICSVGCYDSLKVLDSYSLQPKATRSAVPTPAAETVIPKTVPGA